MSTSGAHQLQKIGYSAGEEEILLFRLAAKQKKKKNNNATIFLRNVPILQVRGPDFKTAKNNQMFDFVLRFLGERKMVFYKNPLQPHL